MRTAVVVGSTGVTGRAIVKHLLDSEQYSNVVSISRRSMQIDPNPKLKEKIVNFENDNWQVLVKGDDLFSAMGTTLKQAGSKEAQYAIDYQLQADAAKAAKAHGVNRLFLVSAPYANAKSRFFYTRIKGELERDVKRLDFDALTIFRPSIIQGDRPDTRIAERIGAGIMNGMTAIIPGSDHLRPIHGDDLGKAIVCAAEALCDEVEQDRAVICLGNRDITRLLKARI